MSKVEDRLFEACSETWDEKKGVERIRRFAVGFGIAWYFELRANTHPFAYADISGFLDAVCQRLRKKLGATGNSRSVGTDDVAAFLATTGCLKNLTVKEVLGQKDALLTACRTAVQLASIYGSTPENFTAMGLAWGYGMALVAAMASHSENEAYWEEVTQFVAGEALNIDTEEEPFEELFMAYYEGHSPDVFPDNEARSQSW